MEERETQARKGAGGRAPAAARWLTFATASAAVLAGAVVTAPAGGGVGASGRLADAQVTATADNAFVPAAVLINQGETVTWTNSGGGEHNVVFDDGSYTNPSTPRTDNWTVSRRFDVANTFTYHCARHPSMTGEVTVNAVASPPGGTPPPGGYPAPGGTPPPPDTPSPGTPGAGLATTTVTLRVSDTTPTRGARVRFFGSVRPEQDGRLLQLQRRARGGSYRTVARIKLSDAGASRSKFSKRLRVLKDTVFRARLPADAAHAAGTSRTTRVDVR